MTSLPLILALLHSGAVAEAPPDPGAFLLAGKMSMHLASGAGGADCTVGFKIPAGKEASGYWLLDGEDFGCTNVFRASDKRPRGPAAGCTISWKPHPGGPYASVHLSCTRQVSREQAKPVEQTYDFTLADSNPVPIPFWIPDPADGEPNGKGALWGFVLNVEGKLVTNFPAPVTLDLLFERAGPAETGPGTVSKSFRFGEGGAAGTEKFDLRLEPRTAGDKQFVPSVRGTILPRLLPGGEVKVEVAVSTWLEWRDVSGGSGEGTGVACGTDLEAKTIVLKPGAAMRLDIPAFRDCHSGFKRAWWAGAADHLYINYPAGK